MASHSTRHQSSAEGTKPNQVWARRDRPCDTCRRRKNRCILIAGETESCVLCQSRSEKCTFVQDPPQKKKARRLNSDKSSPDATKPRSPREVVQDPRTKDVVKDYAPLPGPTLLRKTLGHQNRRSIEYLGITAAHDARLILQPFDNNDEQPLDSNCILRRVDRNTHFIIRCDTQPEIDQEIANLEMVEAIVSPYGRALIDLYFRIVHPSYPILHKQVFLEKYSRDYREITPQGLAAVYILALNWWSYSPNLVRLPKPNVKQLESLFMKMVMDVYDRPKISDLQGGLVFLQRPQGNSEALMAHLMAMGQRLGLHRDCTSWQISDWERALRRRLAWALYIQDKWGALTHGRPPHIAEDNWMVKPPAMEDFPETAKDDNDEEGSSEVEKGMLIFVHLITLTEILAKILQTFFTLRATSMRYNTTEVLEKAKPLQMRLKDWYLSLPSCLSMDETKAHKLSSTGFLHLAYFTVEVTLHRAIINSLDDANTDPNLRFIARNAAKMRFTSAVDFVKKLRPEHLQAFWMSASKSNLAIIGTFGGLLWASSDSKEEADFYTSQLAEYRWTLRVTGAEMMKDTVQMLDASVVFAIESPLKLGKNMDQQRSNELNVSNRTSEDDHEMMNTTNFQDSNLESNNREFVTSMIGHPIEQNWNGLLGGLPSGATPENWEIGALNYVFGSPGDVNFPSPP